MEEQKIIDVDLSFEKSTKGTNIFGNEEAGFRAVYIPKDKFPAGVTPSTAVVRLLLSVK